MKVTFTLALAVVAIFLSGCGRGTLTLNEGSRHLTPILGTESGDIEFINHAVFSKVEEGAEKVDSKKVGLVAITSSELILAEGAATSVTNEEVERIPLVDIEGVAVSGPFLQVLYREYRYLVLPYRWYSDTVDMEQLTVLSEFLKDHSVPTIAADDVQWVRGIIHNAEGSGVHVVGPSRQGSASNAPDTWTLPGSYNGDGSVRDSPNFQPLPR
jgi:hypothetical protein